MTRLKTAAAWIIAAACIAVAAYGFDLVLDLFAFETQVTVGVVLAVLTVAALIWWAAERSSDQLERTEAGLDEMDEIRADIRGLLAHAEEMTLILRGWWQVSIDADQRPDPEPKTQPHPRPIPGKRTDTAEATALIIPAAITEAAPDVEAWAQAQMAEILARHGLQPEKKPTPPRKRTGSTAAKKAPAKATPAKRTATKVQPTTNGEKSA
jgi:membrane protein implicated in regulation of membrane protease activity